MAKRKVKSEPQLLEQIALIVSVGGDCYEVSLTQEQRVSLRLFVSSLFEGHPIKCVDHKLPLILVNDGQEEKVAQSTEASSSIMGS